MSLIAGRVESQRDNYGTVITEDGQVLLISEFESRRVFVGDRVLVRLKDRVRKGLPECSIVKITERRTDEIVGQVLRLSGVLMIAPDNKNIAQDILISPEESIEVKVGQIVTAVLLPILSLRSLPVAKVTKILGEHMDPGMEIDIALRSHGIPYQWPEATLTEAKQLPSRVATEDKKDRLDLRQLPLVTIDGDDAKDFDDAVFCAPLKNGGWHLYVAIADVAHYVSPGSALDVEAQNRGTSVYFPGRVVPMLPTELSNGLCSLNPKVDRLCMVCKMTITSKGTLRSYHFYQAVMRSHARLTYSKVAKILLEDDKKLKLHYRDLVPHLKELYKLFKVLHACREQRGAIDFELPETKIIFVDDKKIAKIVPLQRNDAHRLIEECMLMANVAAADFVLKHQIPALYRIHSGPEQEKFDEVREFLKELGIKIDGRIKPKPKDYAELLRKTLARSDFEIIQKVLLRSLGQAVYDGKNTGHFGLAYEAYCHFTSPIRRYPDLLTHRAIKYILEQGSAKDYIYKPQQMHALGEHSSVMERRADEATRDVVDWLKCEFMQDKIGEIFAGRVSSVTTFGLFVTLDDYYVDGLVHVTSLQNDYYVFDKISHTLVCERSGTIYRLGEPVQVQLTRVSLDDRYIDFELISNKNGKQRKSKKSQSRKRRR